MKQKIITVLFGVCMIGCMAGCSNDNSNVNLDSINQETNTVRETSGPTDEPSNAPIMEPASTGKPNSENIRGMESTPEATITEENQENEGNGEKIQGQVVIEAENKLYTVGIPEGYVVEKIEKDVKSAKEFHNEDGSISGEINISKMNGVVYESCSTIEDYIDTALFNCEDYKNYQKSKLHSQKIEGKKIYYKTATYEGADHSGTVYSATELVALCELKDGLKYMVTIRSQEEVLINIEDFSEFFQIVE